MREEPRIIGTYKFDETSVEGVLGDLDSIEGLPDDIIGDICEAFSSEIIGKLPNGFCVRRIDEFEKEVELYTFY